MGEESNVLIDIIATFPHPASGLQCPVPSRHFQLLNDRSASSGASQPSLKLPMKIERQVRGLRLRALAVCHNLDDLPPQFAGLTCHDIV